MNQRFHQVRAGQDPVLRTRVAARAYAIWLAEGRPPDRALAHWLMAEALVVAELEQGYGQSKVQRSGIRRRLSPAPSYELVS